MAREADSRGLRQAPSRRISAGQYHGCDPDGPVQRGPARIYERRETMEWVRLLEPDGTPGVSLRQHAAVTWCAAHPDWTWEPIPHKWIEEDSGSEGEECEP
jgi:hypothetical protein